jgi:hypothetical protein
LLCLLCLLYKQPELPIDHRTSEMHHATGMAG